MGWEVPGVGERGLRGARGWRRVNGEALSGGRRTKAAVSCWPRSTRLTAGSSGLFVRGREGRGGILWGL